MRYLRYAILTALLLGSAGCVSTYRYDKDTMVVATFGLGVTFYRRKDTELEAAPAAEEETADADEVLDSP